MILELLRVMLTSRHRHVAWDHALLVIRRDYCRFKLEAAHKKRMKLIEKYSCEQNEVSYRRM